MAWGSRRKRWFTGGLRDGTCKLGRWVAAASAAGRAFPLQWWFHKQRPQQRQQEQQQELQLLQPQQHWHRPAAPASFTSSSGGSSTASSSLSTLPKLCAAKHITVLLCWGVQFILRCLMCHWGSNLYSSPFLLGDGTASCWRIDRFICHRSFLLAGSDRTAQLLFFLPQRAFSLF